MAVPFALCLRSIRFEAGAHRLSKPSGEGIEWRSGSSHGRRAERTRMLNCVPLVIFLGGGTPHLWKGFEGRTVGPFASECGE